MSDVIVGGGVGKLEAKDIGILPFTQQFREDHRTFFSSKRRIGVSNEFIVIFLYMRYP